jgi:hypothetical protein
MAIFAIVALVVGVGAVVLLWRSRRPPPSLPFM